MSRKLTSTYLENTVELLVEHFGIGRVRSALAKASNGAGGVPKPRIRQRPSKPDQQMVPSVMNLLMELGQSDPAKCQLLTDFYTRLKDKLVLPESQDIRQFAQLVGLKEVLGKSRKDMIPNLMRVLLERPIERLRRDIEAAANVSEQQRQQGFSVLTDKLLSGTG